MQSFPVNNLVIVMDNACIHKHPEIKELIISQLVHYWFSNLYGILIVYQIVVCTLFSSLRTPQTTILLNLHSWPSKHLSDIMEHYDMKMLDKGKITIGFTYIFWMPHFQLLQTM